MKKLAGVFQTTKKDGSVSFRASITFRSKHNSLGSYTDEISAHTAYQEARQLLESSKQLTPDDYHASEYKALAFRKWISLINFKNNGFYFKTPIYLRSNFFSYHLSPKDVLLFDADDLFYYSNHSIMRRGGHLFVSEYGMQTNIHSRYGIKNFARLNIDYRFVNGDTSDFRYSNIEILNAYHGVTCLKKHPHPIYQAKIHIHGDFIIGKYDTAIKAAVAYNKAADILRQNGCPKNFEKNYIEDLTTADYRTLYDEITISKKIITYLPK